VAPPRGLRGCRRGPGRLDPCVHVMCACLLAYSRRLSDVSPTRIRLLLRAQVGEKGAASFRLQNTQPPDGQAHAAPRVPAPAGSRPLGCPGAGHGGWLGSWDQHLISQARGGRTDDAMRLAGGGGPATCGMRCKCHCAPISSARAGQRRPPFRVLTRRLGPGQIALRALRELPTVSLDRT
jgi:hypothetical protein